MDAIALLKKDHATVESLFRRYESVGDDTEQRTQIVHDIIRELSVHASIEELVLYPEVKDALSDGESLAKEALEEHQEAKEALAELDRMNAMDPAFDLKVRSLIADVRHHVGEEESEMLPKLRSAVSRAKLNELGSRMERAKAVAPTRPHPHAPSTPPLNLAAGAVAGLADRVRDAVSGRAKRQAPARTQKAASRRRTPSARGGKRSGPVIHVTADPKGGWRADKQGSRRAAVRSQSKQDVVRRARDLAKAQGGRLVIHRQDGRIQEERSYGRDPVRTRG